MLGRKLRETLGRDPTAGELDGAMRRHHHDTTRDARLKGFRVAVAQTPDPYDEEALTISHNGGASTQVIHLLPEEKQQVIAALQGSLKK